MHQIPRVVDLRAISRGDNSLKLWPAIYLQSKLSSTEAEGRRAFRQRSAKISSCKLAAAAAAAAAAAPLQSCLTLCDPMDCSLPGSSTHGIFQARVLEWGAIAIPKCYDTRR